MIVVTGGAGFIGSNIVRALINQGKEVAVVDNLTNGLKFKNLSGLDICDYFDKENFRQLISECLEIKENALNIEAILHNGACSSTTEWNGKYVVDNNYEYSRILLTFCNTFNIPFIYASSASVYGLNKNSKEIPTNEKPITVYGYSKLLFDNKVRRSLKDTQSQIVGLRYFNVYGPGEFHKLGQSSPILRYWQTIKDSGSKIKVYRGDDGTGIDAMNHQRDFVYVNDVVNVSLWFLNHPKNSGIFNVGTGTSRSFVDVAENVDACYYNKRNLTLRAGIQYEQFPDHLKGYCQPYTKADLTSLRNIGYNAEFTPLKEGVERYIDWLEQYK